MAPAALIHPSFEELIVWLDVGVVPCSAGGKLCKFITLWAVTFPVCKITLYPVSEGIGVAKLLVQLCFTVAEDVG